LQTSKLVLLNEVWGKAENVVILSRH